MKSRLDVDEFQRGLKCARVAYVDENTHGRFLCYDGVERIVERESRMYRIGIFGRPRDDRLTPRFPRVYVRLRRTPGDRHFDDVC